ncbi:myotubularin-related protein 11 isoform X2 [Ascaphus truei]|uniref:myotubularin-related protein 11 isoform X2 n=1 Tax=Ascaphus truei TaxID=8439 RepID=UPI003F5963DF
MFTFLSFILSLLPLSPSPFCLSPSPFFSGFPAQVLYNVTQSHEFLHSQTGPQRKHGESVQEEAVRVKKRIYFKDGHQYISGTLYCTSHRIAFRPGLPFTSQDQSNQVSFDSYNDVALPGVDRVLAVTSQTKVKVVTPQSNLKFIPEELIIHCKGFRVIHFHFSDNGLQPQAYRITKAIVESQQKNRRQMQQGSPALQSLDNRPSRALTDFPTLLFESSADWEAELERLGTSAWRVSPVNERCDTSTSLSKYLLVPCKLLDHDLKKTFAHFNQRRIPRLCWHHPAGSDLLRSAGYQTNTDPDKDIVRSIGSLLFANHSQCVVVDTTDELPAIADIQLSYVKLRSLCLSDPSAAVSGEKWLSNLEGTRWLDHVRFCLKKASEVSVFLSERRRSVVLQEPEDRDMNCLVTSLVQLVSDPHARTLSGFQSLVQKEWVSAGHPFRQRINPFKETDKEESPVFLLFLDCVWQLVQQFPAAFEFTESYLVALHDGTYNPYCGSFSHNCQWDRIRGSQHLVVLLLQCRLLSQTYTPVKGWRDVVQEKMLLNGGYKPCPPTVWDWDLYYSPLQRQQFQNPMYQSRGLSVLNGNGMLHKPDTTFSDTCPVYLLSRGVLSLQTPSLPWKSGTVSRRDARRASESLLEEERLLRSNASSRRCTADLLLPLCVGPWVRLWRRCYLRSVTEFPVLSPPAPGLAEELHLLQEKLRSLRASEISRSSVRSQAGGVHGPSPYR